MKFQESAIFAKLWTASLWFSERPGKVKGKFPARLQKPRQQDRLIFGWVGNLDSLDQDQVTSRSDRKTKVFFSLSLFLLKSRTELTGPKSDRDKVRRGSLEFQTVNGKKRILFFIYKNEAGQIFDRCGRLLLHGRAWPGPGHLWKQKSDRKGKRSRGLCSCQVTQVQSWGLHPKNAT